MNINQIINNHIGQLNNNKYSSRSLKFESPEVIKKDLFRMLMVTDEKLFKRYERYMIISFLIYEKKYGLLISLFINLFIFIYLFIVLLPTILKYCKTHIKERNQLFTVSTNYIINKLNNNNNGVKIGNIIKIIVPKDTNPNNNIRKQFESKLTEKVNCEISYLISSIILAKLNNYLYNKYCKNIKYQFICKGGTCTRIVLLHSYPKYHKLIKKYFPISDNDSSIYIDPLNMTEEEYNMKVNVISDFIMNKLEEISIEMNNIMQKTNDNFYYHKNIILFGNRYDMNLSNGSKCVINMHEYDKKNNIMYIELYRSYGILKITHSVVNIDKIQSHFNLVRGKLNYKSQINNQSFTFSSEFLDISIPRYNNYSVQNRIKHKNKMELIKININDIKRLINM